MAPRPSVGRHPGRRIASLERAEDFQRVLAQPWLAKSPHFAVHYLKLESSQGTPLRPVPAVGQESGPKLSSEAHQVGAGSVDNFLDNPVDKSVKNLGGLPAAASDPTLRYGLVVPKRLARRAVTRNLLRRQMRQALLDHHDALSVAPQGLWVLRLRSAFDVREYPSAASAALRQAARGELQALVASAPRRAGVPR